MSLIRSLAHNTIIQIAGKIVGSLLGLLAVAIMARRLGTEQFGWYVTAAGFLQFVGVVIDFGFTLIASNLLADSRYDSAKVLNTAFTWRVITATAIHGVALVAFMFFPYPAPIKLAVAILTIAFVALAIQNVFVGYCRARLNLLDATLADIIGKIILVLGVIFTSLQSHSFELMMGAIALAALASAWYLYVKSPAVSFAMDKTISRVLFNKMWPTALAIIFNAIYLQGDRVLLPLFVSPREVAYYGAAYRLIDVILQLAAILMGMTMPLLAAAWAEKDKEKFQNHYRLAFNLLNLILVPLVIGAFVLAEPLMRLVAGPAFAPAGKLLQGLSVSVVGISAGMLFGHVALAIGRERQSLIVFITDAALSLIAYLYFIPRYGVWGAVGVTIFSELYAGVGLAIICRRSAPATLQFAALAKIIMAGLIMGAVVWYAYALPVALTILIGAISYAALALLFKIISLTTIKDIVRLKPVAPEAKV